MILRKDRYVMYYREIYVFDGNRPIRAIIRNYTEKDFDDLIRIQQESFPPPFPAELWWNKQQLHNHVTIFPQGALCVEIDGEVVGSITGLLVPFDPNHVEHSWSDITDNGYIRNHDPSGNVLYGVDIGVRPSFRKFGLGKWLILSMCDIVIHLGVERFVGGGRMPMYYQKKNDMSAQQYIQAVVDGEWVDPVVTFLMKCGLMPVCAIANYLEDEESCNYGALVEWKNPFR